MPVSERSSASRSDGDAAPSTIRTTWQRSTLIVLAGAIVLLLFHGIAGAEADSYEARQAVFALTAGGLVTTIALSLFSLRPMLLPDAGLAGSPANLERRIQVLRQQVAELERSNQELQEFASTAGHDLREPLRMIKNYLDLLEDAQGEDLGEDAREYLRYVDEGAERMDELLEGLLAYARAGATPSFEQVSLDDVVEDALENLRARIAGTDAVVERGSLPTVEGDHTQLVQVFQNLIANALKFHKEGQAPVVRIDADRDGGRWRIDVEDEGVGFEPDEKASMFAIFERGRAAQGLEGSGIGLAVCTRIVARHGGEIDATATPGEGATFSVYLPVAEQAPRPAVRERSRELV